MRIEITRAEWRKIPRDYKAILAGRAGIRVVLAGALPTRVVALLPNSYIGTEPVAVSVKAAANG